jgi:hypothetical protein
MSTPMARIADMTEASFNRTVGNEFPLGANVLRLPTNRYESPKIATQATVKLEHARARLTREHLILTRSSATARR